MPLTADAGYGQFGMAMQVGGALSSAIGAYSSIRGQKSQLRMQAVLDAINAQTAERSAQSSLAAGQHEEQASMLRTAALRSSQEAHFASSGVALNEGSAARVLTSTDVMGAIDANTIHANAVRQAWGYRTQAVNASNAGLAAATSADSLSAAGAGATSLLGSAGSVAQNWYMLNKSGAFGPAAATADGFTINPQAGP
jgi:hypothetical protein